MTAYEQTPEYWVGSLAMTIAVATAAPDPKPILRPALRRFLAQRPHGDELGDMLRSELGKVKL